MKHLSVLCIFYFGFVNVAFADWFAEEQSKTQMLENRVRQIQAVEQIRQNHDDSYARRYTSTVPRNMYECTKQRHIAECTELSMSGLYQDPNFQSFSPNRQNLIIYYNQQRFQPFLQAVEAQCDLANLNRMERALHLTPTKSLPTCQQSKSPERLEQTESCKLWADVSSEAFMAKKEGLTYTTATKLTANRLNFYRIKGESYADRAAYYGWDAAIKYPKWTINQFKAKAYSHCMKG